MTNFQSIHNYVSYFHSDPISGCFIQYLNSPSIFTYNIDILRDTRTKTPHFHVRHTNTLPTHPRVHQSKTFFQHSWPSGGVPVRYAASPQPSINQTVPIKAVTKRAAAYYTPPPAMPSPDESEVIANGGTQFPGRQWLVYNNGIR